MAISKTDLEKREALLVKLHERVLTALLEAIDSPNADPRMLEIARKFLADNSISALLDAGVDEETRDQVLKLAGVSAEDLPVGFGVAV